MTWNHRVTKEVFRFSDGGPEEEGFAIREVYYDDDGKIISWTAEPIDVVGDTVEEVRDTLQRMLECLDKPVINVTDENHPHEEGAS